jgi:hypothetical protein
METEDRNELKHILAELEKDFEELGVEGAQAKGKEKATFANSRNNIAKSMIMGYTLLNEPKYIALSPDLAKKTDLARWMQAYKEEEDKKLEIFFRLSFRAIKEWLVH